MKLSKGDDCFTLQIIAFQKCIDNGGSNIPPDGESDNGWVDVQGRAYVLYPLAGLAEDLQSSISSVTRALRELEAARLIERRPNGFSKPNQIFLGVPRTAQKCSIGMVKNEQPDCSKVSNHRQPLPQQETTDRYHEPGPDGVEEPTGYRTRPHL